MELIQSTHIKNSFSNNINFYIATPKRKITNDNYSPKKIMNLLKRENQAGVEQHFLNPQRIQKKIKKERDNSKKKSTLRNKNFNNKIENISKKILDKYKNPYMEYLCKDIHYFAAFVKNQKPTYYNFFQTNYILDKKKCSLYINYKDHKLFLDNQEFFLKYFTKRESRIYINYLLYFIYAKDPYVKSNKTYCINKDRDHLKEEYNELIINNVFGAKKIIYTQGLEKIPIIYNKNDTNIDPKLYDKKILKKSAKIAIPKYYLNIKPIISEINYLFIKDVPNTKIPNIIPNYTGNDLGVYYVIKNLILKNKYSIYVINYKEFLFNNNYKKQSNNKYKTKDNNNILNSFISNDSKNGAISSDRNLLNISKKQNENNELIIHSIYKRLKNDIDIIEIENLTKKIINLELKKEENENLLKDDDILKNYENENDIFLSTLKKPFIGNRTRNDKEKIDTKMETDIKSLTKTKEKYEEDSKIDISKAVNEKIKFLKKKNEEIEKKHPLYLYADKLKKKNNNMFNLFLNFYDIGNNKEKKYKLKYKNKSMLNNYFPDRFLNPKKYRQYLINSPFLRTLQKIEYSLNSFNPIKNENKINNIKTLQNKRPINFLNNKINSFSPNKKLYSFKETYKFLKGMNEKENKNALRQKIFNTTNTFYQQFKTLNYATKNRSNFKKSGAFAFSSFSGSNYDKTENEWKESADIEVHNSYIHSFFASNLMKKINSDSKKKQITLKNCTTFKEIAKCPNIYT